MGTWILWVLYELYIHNLCFLKSEFNQYGLP